MAIPLAPTLKKSYWPLVSLGGLYVLFLFLLTVPSIQRGALYANRVSTAGWWHNLSEPEQFGFLNGQVQERWITTVDDERLYCWHVLPVGAYSKHELDFSSSGDGDRARLRTAELLRDPRAKVIVNFHGNAGHVAQGWRTDTYHTLTAADNEHAHVLTCDYRGYGHSTGTPTEAGLIRDGVAVVEAALAMVPAERVVLVGNSLGVAVTIAVAEELRRSGGPTKKEKKGVELAGLVLVAGFGDLPTLMSTYAVFHAIPVFSPLAPYPRLRKFFEDRILDTWDNVGRLYNYTRSSLLSPTTGSTSVTIIHARNDYDIPWSHSSALFYAAANGTSAEGMTVEEMNAATETRTLKRGGFVNEWRTPGAGGKLTKIKQIVLRDGGHNRIMTFPAITKAVMEMFQ